MHDCERPLIIYSDSYIMPVLVIVWGFVALLFQKPLRQASDSLDFEASLLCEVRRWLCGRNVRRHPNRD